jgi:hypothetical protein
MTQGTFIKIQTKVKTKNEHIKNGEDVNGHHPQERKAPYKNQTKKHDSAIDVQ